MVPKHSKNRDDKLCVLASQSISQSQFVPFLCYCLYSSVSLHIARDARTRGRFNFFRTKGFEKDVGQRTDLWFLNQLKLPGHRGFVGNNLRGQTDSRFDESVKPQKYLLPIVYAKPPDCGPKNTASCGPFGSKVRWTLQPARFAYKFKSKKWTREGSLARFCLEGSYIRGSSRDKWQDFAIDLPACIKHVLLAVALRAPNRHSRISSTMLRSKSQHD